MPLIRETLLFWTNPYQFNLRGYHSLRHLVPENFVSWLRTLCSPHLLLSFERDSVCPSPCSLAAIKGITYLFSIPAGTKMFQFSAFPLFVAVFNCRVSPFGYPRISVYLLLPGAFRCSSRPSSAPSAKAFTIRSFFLNFATVYPLFKDHCCLFVRKNPSGLSKPNRNLQVPSESPILWRFLPLRKLWSSRIGSP